MTGIGRKTFALYTIGSILVFRVSIVLFALIAGNLYIDYTTIELITYLAFFLIGVIWLWAEFQRLKNLNQRGWLILLGFVPLVNIGFFLYLLFTPPATDYLIVNKPKTEPKLDSITGYCPKCGTPRKEDDFYCHNCGHKFD
jgi:uncharacterized membrane protein YhaH (DUF805 family)